VVRLLVIDDDADVAELLKVIGRQAGVSVISFNVGTAALVFLEQNDVDAVILDLQLPVLDGLTIAEQIRLNEENHPMRKKTEIIFLTGAIISDAISRIAKRTNVRRICQKPCDLIELVADIQSWAPGVV
jgi:two-component system CAI-1 autoinducer sensor kinase/phosphatase CqsS